MRTISLPFRLPGLNEYQFACRRSPFAGAKMKKDCIRKVQAYLGKESPFEWPVNVEIYYIEPNKKRDIDNITGFGAKVILDAFVKQGLLPDDSTMYVKMLSQSVEQMEQAEILIRVIEKNDPDFIGHKDTTWPRLFKKLGIEENQKEDIIPIRTKSTKTTKRNTKCSRSSLSLF